MKIALLHYSAPPVVGGVESVIGHHARLMADAGEQVRIVAARGEQWDAHIPFERIPLADSRDPQILEMKSSLDRGQVPTEFKELTARILQALDRALHGTDCLIAHNVCSLNKNLALTAALYQLSLRPDRPRMILWHHDLAWTSPRYQDELHEGYPWELLRTAWPGVRQVTISEFRRRELAALFGIPQEHIWVVPNGVDAAAFLKLADQTQELVAGLKLMGAAPLLLLPVRITPRKNIELALHVLAELRKHSPQAMLVVTGPPGPHNPANQGYLEKLHGLREHLGLAGAAHFLAESVPGVLPDAVIADLYRLADALFLPSLEEGFGIPVLEAGLAGIPVFCSDIPPLRELGEGFANFFQPTAVPSEIAGLIAARLGDDPVLGLRQRVRSGYTWEQIYQTQISPLIQEG